MALACFHMLEDARDCLGIGDFANHTKLAPTVGTALHASAGIVGTDALPHLTRGVHYFGIFVSILDPMSCLLKKTVCKDADNKTNKGAATCVAVFERSARKFFEDNKTLVEQAFSFVIDKKVPMKSILQDINAIIEFSQSEKKTFDSTVSQIGDSLSHLSTAMKPTHHYTDNREQIENVLIDEEFAKTASALFDEIQKALPPSLELA